MDDKDILKPPENHDDALSNDEDDFNFTGDDYDDIKFYKEKRKNFGDQVENTGVEVFIPPRKRIISQNRDEETYSNVPSLNPDTQLLEHQDFSTDILNDMIHFVLGQRNRLTTTEIMRSLVKMFNLSFLKESELYEMVFVGLRSDMSRFTEIKMTRNEELKLHDIGKYGSSLWELNPIWFGQLKDLSKFINTNESLHSGVNVDNKWTPSKTRSMDWVSLCKKAIQSASDLKKTQAEIAHWIRDNDPTFLSLDDSTLNRRISSTLSERKDIFAKLKWKKEDREPTVKGRRSNWWILRDDAIQKELHSTSKSLHSDSTTWKISSSELRAMLLDALEKSPDRMLTTLELRNYLRDVHAECRNIQPSFLTAIMYRALKSPEGLLYFVQVLEPSEDMKKSHEWGPRGSILWTINPNPPEKNPLPDELCYEKFEGDGPSLEPSVMRDLISEVLERSPEGKLTTLEIRKQVYKNFPEYRRYDQTKLTPCIRNALTSSDGNARFKHVDVITELDRKLHEWGTRGATLWTLSDQSKVLTPLKQATEEVLDENAKYRDLVKWEKALREKERELEKRELEIRNRELMLNATSNSN